MLILNIHLTSVYKSEIIPNLPVLCQWGRPADGISFGPAPSPGETRWPSYTLVTGSHHDQPHGSQPLTFVPHDLLGSSCLYCVLIQNHF